MFSKLTTSYTVSVLDNAEKRTIKAVFTSIKNKTNMSRKTEFQPVTPVILRVKGRIQYKDGSH